MENGPNEVGKQKKYHFWCVFGDFQWFSMIFAPARPAAGLGRCRRHTLQYCRPYAWSYLGSDLDFQMHAISRLLGVRWCRWTFIKVEIAVFRFLLVSSRQMNCKLGQFSMAWKNSEIASGNTLILMCYQIQKSTCRILKKCPDKKYFSDFQLSLYLWLPDRGAAPRGIWNRSYECKTKKTKFEIWAPGI